jgi:predicted anti-sigma-YlaC factor YlaD
MTGQIIQMPCDDHRNIRQLLPWFVTGKLEVLERERVQAHLEHCAECREELATESNLARHMAQQAPAVDAPDVERGLRLISRSLDADLPARAPRGRSGWLKAAAPWLGWAVAAQCLLLLGVVLWRGAAPATYHALGSAAPSDAANVVVIFRPETPERELRALLRSSGARVVGGPTTSDAYLLRVAPAARAAIVARLRQESEIVVVEPLDGG